MKPVIGVIGGIGSGKSLVAELLAQRGGHAVNADRLGHEAYEQPAIRAAVMARWGNEVLKPDGSVDRKQLAAIVFADPRERQALEEMVFPWIEKRLHEEIARGQANPAVGMIVLDAAILLEAGWSKECDKLVYVEAPRPLRLQRLAEARGWTEKEVHDREQAQLPLSEKRNRADAVLENCGSLEELNRQVEELLRRWGIDEEAKRKIAGDSLLRDATDDNKL